MPERELNDLCKEYEPLVKSLAARYIGKGIEFEDLSGSRPYSALARALPKFDPQLGLPGIKPLRRRVHPQPKEVELDVRRLEFSMDQVDGFLSALEARTRA